MQEALHNPLKEKKGLWEFDWLIELRCEVCDSFLLIGSSKEFYRYAVKGKCAFCDSSWGFPEECKNLFRALLRFLDLKRKFEDTWKVFFEKEKEYPVADPLILGCEECKGLFGISIKETVLECLKEKRSFLEEKCPYCGRTAEGIWELVDILAEIIRWSLRCRDAGFRISLLGK